MLCFLFQLNVLVLDSVSWLTAMKDENCSPLMLVVSYPSQFCLVWVVLFLYCQDLLHLYYVFSSSLFGNGLIAHVFVFLFLLPLIHFPVLNFDSFLNQLDFCYQIYFTLQENLSVLYSLSSFFLKYVCFHLHDTVPGKMFFGPTFFTSEIFLTFLYHFFGIEYCCGKECDGNLFLFFLLYVIWFFASILDYSFLYFQVQQINQKFPRAEGSLCNYSHQNLRCDYCSPCFGSPEKQSSSKSIKPGSMNALRRMPDGISDSDFVF